MKQISLRVEKEPEPEAARLDKFIPAVCQELSRGLVRQLIERGGVYLNGKRCKVAARSVKLGDQIRVMIPERRRETNGIDQNSIVFENADWIIVNKPPYLPTHATLDNSRDHLVELLKKFLSLRDKQDQVYLGVHHRLDRDTSGLILFTRRKEANAAVAKAFQERQVHKTYLAVCCGVPPPAFTVKNYLGRDPRNKRRHTSVNSGGDYAETHFRTLETQSYEGHFVSLVEAKPVTGRTHQIRVHLSGEGFPILGDDLYGKTLPGIKRLMLHAWKLSLLNREWQSPIPLEFGRLAFKHKGA